MKKKIVFTLLLITTLNNYSKDFYSAEDYTYVGIQKHGVRVAIKGELQGVIDKSGKIILPPVYRAIKFVDDKIIYLKEDGNVGITSISGEKVFKKEYDYIYPLGEDYFLIQGDNKIGLIDKFETVIIPPKYDEIRPFEDDMAVVRVDKKYGVIDKSGKEIIPLEYDYIKNFSNGMALTINKKNLVGFLNKDGVKIVPETYTYSEDFQEESTVVGLNKEYGVIGKNGEFLIPLEERKINSLGKGLYSVKEGELFYIKNIFNKKILDKGFENVGEIIDGLLPVCIDDKFGYVNIEGNEVIPVIYSELGDPKNSLIIVKDETTQKFGVINLQNEFVIKPEYEYITSRSKELFVVGNEDLKEGVVDTKGNVLLPLEYSELEFRYDNLIAGIKDGENKLISINQHEVKELDLNIGEIVDYNENEIISLNKEGVKIHELLKYEN